jgi:uncharacterized membrane protein
MLYLSRRSLRKCVDAQRVAQAFWEDVAAFLSARFRRGGFTEGLVDGIHLVEDRLASHFPRIRAKDQDELPEEVDFP